MAAPPRPPPSYGRAAGPTAASRPITVDDLMKLRSINDVRIAPAGDRVAYVVSTPSLPKNEHDAALFLVPASGGAPTRLGESIRIFNVPTPRPQLRWSPDGSTISLVAFEGGRPQVFGVPVSGAAPRALTTAPEGVFAYEWAPDGKSLAYITRDPMPADEERQRQDRSFVIRADAPERSTRLVVQRLDGSAPRALTPPVTVCRRLVVVARRPRDRVLRGAADRIHGRLRRPPLHRRRRQRRVANDRRSPGHEHRPALFAGRPADRLHLDQRPQRRHGDAQSDPRRGGRRHAAHLRARRCLGQRVRVGARQPLDLPGGQRRHVRTRASTCSSSRSCD